MKPCKLAAALLLSLSLLAPSATALDLNRTELQSAGNEAIRFENYMGPHAIIESADAITSIGSNLGRQVARDVNEPGSYGTGAKYSVIHAVGPEDGARLDADILIISPDATVDHIRNLRRIITGYLMAAYGLERADADIQSTFITVYNAVYRGRMDVFQSKYKGAVTGHLTSRACGLSTRWSEWPGSSQIVIPLADLENANPITTINNSVLSDGNVTNKMREDDDMGVDVRRGMADIITRAADEYADRAEEDAEKAEQARRDAEAQQRLADKAAADAAEADRAARDAEARAEQARRDADAARQNIDDSRAAADEAAARADEAEAAAGEANARADEAEAAAGEANARAGDSRAEADEAAARAEADAAAADSAESGAQSAGEAAADAAQAAADAGSAAEEAETSADAAQAAADAARAAADAARKYADEHPDDPEAQRAAEEAERAAAEAQAAADAAKAAAEAAQAEADRAAAEAEALQQDADAAKAAAEEARAQADRAAEEAARAEAEAVKAEEEAAKAEEEAARARSDADAATDEAEEARSDADAAEEDAQKAEEDAQKAEEDAQKAEEDAQKAEEDAQKAEEDAKASQEKADEQNAQADELEKKAEEEQKKADELEEEATVQRNKIAEDQQRLLKMAMENLESENFVIGLKLVDAEKELSAMVKVDVGTGNVLRQSPVAVIRRRTVLPVGIGKELAPAVGNAPTGDKALKTELMYMAICGENTGNGAVKLCLLDTQNMEIQYESNEVVAEQSVLVQDGDNFYCVIQSGNDWVVGKYDASLKLLLKSPVKVSPDTPITISKKGMVVTDGSGKITLLDMKTLDAVAR